MFRILLLTKCPYAGLQSEKIIRKLGYEVFCSASLLDMLKNRELSIDFLQKFQIILLSNTIPNKEVIELLERIKGHNSIVIQMVENHPVEEELSKKVKQGIHYHLSEQATLEMIREALSLEGEIHVDGVNRSHSSFSGETNLLSQLTLTGQERKVLHELMESSGQVLSRKELCQRIWQTEPTSSNQSQLSLLIKKIKKKMDDANLDSSCVRTLWGKGYLLDSDHLRKVSSKY
ncbi:winged helix-turn-helix domain-containing protein [Enterococcus malodoratus]|uniref:OmpR/PhoB-type domain-containing protein n=1 Tax=Enterococcus malodoratus ATCC 43197 TaxID=1158601 RepID=R2R1G4_9ENTE|nr:winged helix-turn-helix domain-containing protein [Enterococcus malodoratus]EOH77510.1 hypothetical protein UAI_02147 [Enterococcus malodoratus ATCC 43197]EOT64076.1 hypothetical protein I585_03273 [Enterococcus malodoratus ATCC 43197]OJG61218.1 hypothetical protein RV07_GL002065 [Enterococcus malodoratus]SPX00920.1 transcriptional regulatory protein [Enterococcus malodoratus]STD66132.1 transcriptional regulatory protein [Enterococcus malodoratus]